MAKLLEPINYIVDDIYVDEGDMRILLENVACSEVEFVDEDAGLDEEIRLDLD